MKTYRSTSYGIAIVPKATTESNTPGDMEVLIVDGKLRLWTKLGVNDPIVQESLSATLTNKILTGNTAANLVSGSGTLVLNTSGTITVPNGTDTLVGLDLSQTLTNKTMSGASNTFTNIPKGAIPADTVYTDDTQNLTNKSISGALNSLFNIPNASLINSSITINGSSVSLGGSVTVSASTTSTLTIGAGLSGGSFNGSAPVTITIDSSVVTLNDTQTLTNKTLTSPILASPTVIEYILADDSANLTILGGSSNRNINLTAQGTGDINLTCASGQISLNGIEVNTTNQIISTLSSDMEIRAKTGQNTKIGVFTGSVLLQNNGSTQASVTTTGITLASGKTLVLTNNSQTVTQQASASASASYTVTWPAAAPAAGTALVYDGSDYVWASAGGWDMNTSMSLAGGGTIAISLTTGQQVWEVSSSGGAVTLSTTPFGSSDPSDGVVIRLIGRSNTNTVKITNNDAANGCLLNGDATLLLGYVIELQYLSSIDRWVEIARNF